MVDLNKTNMFNKNVISNLKKEYLKSMKNSDFEEYIRKIRLPHETLMKYTSRLETCFKEQTNCSNCKGLEQCKNEIYGFYLKEELDLTKCALLPNLDCSDGAASLEFHHFPMNQ